MNDLKTTESPAALNQEEFFSDLLDHCSDLVHRVTPEGRFIYVNKAWRETLGYSEEEIKNLSLMDIVDESCRNKCICVFNSLIKGEEIGNNETVFISRSGEKIAVEGRCRTTFHNGKPVAMTGFFRDISDRIKNIAALREIILIGEQPEPHQHGQYPVPEEPDRAVHRGMIDNGAASSPSGWTLAHRARSGVPGNCRQNGQRS